MGELRDWGFWGTYGGVEHRADRVDVRAQQEELADLAHNLLVAHVYLARLADDLGYVLRLFYRRRDEFLKLEAPRVRTCVRRRVGKTYAYENSVNQLSVAADGARGVGGLTSDILTDCASACESESFVLRGSGNLGERAPPRKREVRQGPHM